MPERTVENIMNEAAWLAPELRRDKKFMAEWCDKKFACSMDEHLFTQEDVDNELAGEEL